MAQYEFRIIRPADGAVRWLHDTSFPIRDEHGAVTWMGGITDHLTQRDERQVYVVSMRAAEARRLASLIREVAYRARTLESGSAFLHIAPVLAPGCVLVDLRKVEDEGLSIPRELNARSLVGVVAAPPCAG